MRKILRIDLANLSWRRKALPKKYAGLGGRALSSALVAAEVPPTCEPLRAHNKLVFAPGLLGGTGAPTGGRLSVGAKSPLTGGIKESNAGGEAGNALARLGIAALVLENAPADDQLRVIKITKKGVTFLPADGIAGLGNYETVEKLFAEHGEKVAIISIGMAGEMMLSTASVAVTDMERRPTRHAGRGGMGAVMGSKKVKAIVLDTEGCERPESVDPERLRAAIKTFAQELAAHATTGTNLPMYGTNVLMNIINAAGDLPTRNFRTGQFEGVGKICGETQRDIILKRGGVATHACHKGCTMKCSRIYVDEKGEYITKGPEYETIWAHGANCGIDDLDVIARMDRLEDEIGIDTIEMGATLAVAMEAGIIKFGDGAGALALVEEVGKGTPLGRILGSGAETTAQCFGVRRCPTVKRQSMPAYDPRAAKGQGVTYATSPMGADHTAGYMVAQNILAKTVDPFAIKGQAEGSRDTQIAAAAIDSTGLCLFCAFMIGDSKAGYQAMLDMINAHLGLSLDAEGYLEMGRRTLRRERGFNKGAGFTKEDDRIPEFMMEEPLPPHNAVFDIPDKELDKVHKY
ncbi:MAG: aldehyde ferredoxin oxidoreductase C-terminal domain-containing protein [Planctomycetota bacterium]